MADTPFSIAPTGYLTRFDIGQWHNGLGTSGTALIAAALPGGSFQAQGRGEFPLNRYLSGVRGTLDVTFVTGAPGSARAIAFLVEDAATPTKYIGVAVDASNRPYALLSVDGVGTVLSQTTVYGPPIPAGTVVRARVSFDSSGPILDDLYALFLEGSLFNDAWTPQLTFGWTPFQPTTLLVGAAMAGLLDYNGGAPWVQLSQVPVSTGASRLTVSPESAALSGSAAVGALGVVSYVVEAAVAGSAAVGASAKVLYAVTAPSGGTAAVTADLTLSLAPP